MEVPSARIAGQQDLFSGLISAIIRAIRGKIFALIRG
jgi:hypothetical protein